MFHARHASDLPEKISIVNRTYLREYIIMRTYIPNFVIGHGFAIPVVLFQHFVVLFVSPVATTDGRTFFRGNVQ